MDCRTKTLNGRRVTTVMPWFVVAVVLAWTTAMPAAAGVTDAFVDSFNRADNNTVGNGWIETERQSDDCAIRNNYCRVRDYDPEGTIKQSGISTAGLKDVTLSYRWRALSDDTESDDFLHVQWKPSGAGSWLDVATHVLDNNTSYQTEVWNLGPQAENTSIDIRFWVAVDCHNGYDCNCCKQEEGAKLDDVAVRGSDLCKNDAECDDGDACTADTCDPQLGCVNEPIDCDDGDECTVDSCDPKTGCVNEPIDCDDGDPCTEDYCEHGKCQHTPKDCDDGDPCTEDVCQEGKCKHELIDCGDGNPCTDDSCVDGECVHQPDDAACDDGNECTIDRCDPQEGCINEPLDCGENGDRTHPEITCPLGVDVIIGCDESADPADTGEATATDNCDADPVISFSDEETPGDCPSEKIIMRTWTATDECGNTDECVQTIVVEDNTAPTITCEAVGGALDASGQASVSFEATVVDNCCVFKDDVSVDVEPMSGSPATVTFTANAKDCCGNPAEPCTDAAEVAEAGGGAAPKSVVSLQQQVALGEPDCVITQVDERTVTISCVVPATGGAPQPPPQSQPTSRPNSEPIGCGVGVCGTATLNMMPLMLLGLGLMKLNLLRRRRTAR